jgi:predicted Ser/Thr protein kinase
MDPERWRLLKEVFWAALEKSPEERRAFLNGFRREEPSLATEVEALLANYSHDSLLDKNAREAFPGLHDHESTEAAIGRQLGPYAINGEIGRGGMGVVYLAYDTRLDRQVALKMLAPQFTGDTKQRERLKREARAVAKLSYPGIATVYSLEELDNNVFIVTEYVQGPTLRQILSRGILPYREVLDISVQIGRGLVAAHDEGIVHRDLKPENIIRSESGIVKILDFGLARVQLHDGSSSNSHLTQSGMFLGTPAYASPEQLLGSNIDRSSDIFSFGVMMYEMAAGKHPFKSEDSISLIARILEADPPDLSQTNPVIPQNFRRIMLRCIKKSPSERYENTKDLVKDLEGLWELRAETQAIRSSGALWWWQFHQAVAGFGYYAMLYPLWIVKKSLGGIEGSLLFFPALIAVGIAANLRLHLWFTSKYYVSELAEQRRKVARWVRGADCLFVLVLAICAVRNHTEHAIIATLLMAVAIGALVAFALIEPTTARAALDKQQQT